jgi:hypothetical protein
MAVKHIIGKMYSDSATGAAAIAYSTANEISQAGVHLKEIRIGLSAAGGAGNLTVTINSALGAVYDTVVDTTDMTTVTDYYYKPPEDSKLLLFPGDTIDVAWANGSTRTYGLEAVYEVYCG